MEQTLRSHNLTYFLENIIKSAWYVLPPGGMSACRKWIVCTDLKKGTCIFVWLKCENVAIWITRQSLSFNVAMNQTSWSHNLTRVLENIVKPAWHILPPGGRTACRKCSVCSYKIHGFVLQVKCQETCLFVSYANRNRLQSNLTSVLDNIAKTAWYVLPPGSTTACWKWRVCIDLKNAHVFVCDWSVKTFLFESNGNRRFLTLWWNRLQGHVVDLCARKFHKATLVRLAISRHDCV